jgi:hypothetical protein
MEIIRQRGKLSKKDRKIALQLARLNHVRWEMGYPFEIVPPAPKQAFIPNTFVTGVADETPPLERLRRLQDPLLLRLAVDLYHVHFESGDGGVPKTVIRRKHVRQQVAEFGPYAICQFQPNGATAYSCETTNPHIETRKDKLEWSSVWRRFDALEQTGVLEWVPILFEAANDEAEPPFPLGHKGSDSMEDLMGTTSHDAAVRMLSRRYNLSVGAPGLAGPSSSFQLVPLFKHFEQATLNGIARLRYRAHTARTGIWFAELEQRSAEYLERWRQIIENMDLHAKDAAYSDAASG